MNIETMSDIMIIHLSESYDIVTMCEILQIVKDKEIYHTVKYLIIDFSNLQAFSDGGGEISILMQELDIKLLVYVNLPHQLFIPFNELSIEIENKELIQFSDINTAIKFIDESRVNAGH